MKEKIVCVEWEDAGFYRGSYDRDDPDFFIPVATKSVGHLIKSDKKRVIISMQRFYGADGESNDERYLNIIPRKMIKKITYLKE